MNVLAIAVTLALLPGLAPLRAEDAPPKAAKSSWTDVKRWLDNLKAGLTESAVRRRHRDMHGLTAVAAVRGDEQAVEDPDKVYFKSAAASKAERATRKERAELRKAVQLALDGKPEDAVKALGAFEEAHPQSPLLEECRQARGKLQALAEPVSAPQEPAASTPAPVTEAEGGQRPAPAAQ